MIARKIKIFIMALGLMALSPAIWGHAAGIKWERIASVHVSDHTPGSSDTEHFELSTDDNMRLYLWLSRTSTVRIVTILGQQISLETLQPGCHRLKILAKGIYILKIGDVTKKIVV